ncbi:hypothetical protein ABK040_009848 [Willaertia magna]
MHEEYIFDDLIASSLDRILEENSSTTDVTPTIANGYSYSHTSSTSTIPNNMIIPNNMNHHHIPTTITNHTQQQAPLLTKSINNTINTNNITIQSLQEKLEKEKQLNIKLNNNVKKIKKKLINVSSLLDVNDTMKQKIKEQEQDYKTLTNNFEQILITNKKLEQEIFTLRNELQEKTYQLSQNEKTLRDNNQKIIDLQEENNLLKRKELKLQQELIEKNEKLNNNNIVKVVEKDNSEELNNLKLKLKESLKANETLQRLLIKIENENNQLIKKDEERNLQFEKLQNELKIINNKPQMKDISINTDPIVINNHIQKPIITSIMTPTIPNQKQVSSLQKENNIVGSAGVEENLQKKPITTKRKRVKEKSKEEIKKVKPSLSSVTPTVTPTLVTTTNMFSNQGSSPASLSSTSSSNTMRTNINPSTVLPHLSNSTTLSNNKKSNIVVQQPQLIVEQNKIGVVKNKEISTINIQQPITTQQRPKIAKVDKTKRVPFKETTPNTNTTINIPKKDIIPNINFNILPQEKIEIFIIRIIKSILENYNLLFLKHENQFFIMKEISNVCKKIVKNFDKEKIVISVCHSIVKDVILTKSNSTQCNLFILIVKKLNELLNNNYLLNNLLLFTKKLILYHFENLEEIYENKITLNDNKILSIYDINYLMALISGIGMLSNVDFCKDEKYIFFKEYKNLFFEVFIQSFLKERDSYYMIKLKYFKILFTIINSNQKILRNGFDSQSIVDQTIICILQQLFVNLELHKKGLNEEQLENLNYLIKIRDIFKFNWKLPNTNISPFYYLNYLIDDLLVKLKNITFYPYILQPDLQFSNCFLLISIFIKDWNWTYNELIFTKLWNILLESNSNTFILQIILTIISTLGVFRSTVVPNDKLNNNTSNFDDNEKEWNFFDVSQDGFISLLDKLSTIIKLDIFSNETKLMIKQTIKEMIMNRWVIANQLSTINPEQLDNLKLLMETYLQ